MNFGAHAQMLLALAVIIIVAQLLGSGCRRLGQPAVIGEIFAGVLLGPTLFHGAVTKALFPIHIRPAMSSTAARVMSSRRGNRASCSKNVRITANPSRVAPVLLASSARSSCSSVQHSMRSSSPHLRRIPAPPHGSAENDRTLIRCAGPANHLSHSETLSQPHCCRQLLCVW